jgi:hypothetical protein
MMPRPRPETNENLATKARRHKGLIYNKTFCVTLCLGVFVANFMAGREILCGLSVSSCLQIKKRIPAPFALYTVYLVALQRL